MTLMYCLFDTNVKFNKQEYNIMFKSKEIKLCNGGAQNKDLLILNCEELDEQQSYKLITELLSCLSLSLDAVFIPAEGVISSNNTERGMSACNKISSKRSILLERETLADFMPLFKLISEEQITFARLYRIAISANDVYFKILFYWHCLVYPDQSDDKAVSVINDLEKGIPQSMQITEDTLERIKSERIKLEEERSENESQNNKNKPQNNKNDKRLGNYIKEEIRHSIAHIVRDPAKSKGLEIDSIRELRHLNDICDLLKGMARYKILEEKGISKNKDLSGYFEVH